MSAVAIDLPCAICGWPAAFAIHRQDQRGNEFVTTEGIKVHFVRGHQFADHLQISAPAPVAPPGRDPTATSTPGPGPNPATESTVEVP